MSKFQLILTAIFGAFILIGVLVFAFGQSSGSKNLAKVTVWGTMSQSLWNDFMRTTGLDLDKTVSITYVEERRETFDQDLVEALAIGKGPDLFFLPQDSILKHQDKIFVIPYASYPEQTFKDTFAQEGELFLTSQGVLGIPFIIDPMVMYWNRVAFSNAGLSVPPKFWSELYDLSTKLTVKDENLNITKSAVAFGEYTNVTNANEIFSLLTMQAGSPITLRNADDSIENLFNQRQSLPVAPAFQALNFYTEFSNPLKSFYSWNRSLPDAKSYFLSGDLAIYFGFASELGEIRLKNPYLNFDVAAMPQTKGSNQVTTFGKMIALAISRNSHDVAGSFRVATLLTSAANLTALTQLTNLPPVRRDLLAVKPAQGFLPLFYDSAIQSRAWLSPEKDKLSPIFQEMIESVTSGRSSVNDVLNRAQGELDNALK